MAPMNTNDPLFGLLVEIHKQLAHIANSLDALARVARQEHPDAFKQRLPAATVHREQQK
jgi:hypothetical protein